MNSIWNWLTKVDLIYVVLALLFLHSGLYYLLGTTSWLMVAFMATGVWTVTVALLQVVAKKQRQSASPKSGS